MKTNLMIATVAAALLAGCAHQPPPAATVYDPVSGGRTDVSENLLAGTGQPREVIWLNAFRDVESYYQQAKFFLEVQYVAPAEVGYLEIPPGKTLVVNVDGQPLQFTGSGSQNRRREFSREGSNFVREGALYPVTRLDLQKLATAKQVKIQIKGNNGLVEREFAPENFERIQAFVKRAAL